MKMNLESIQNFVNERVGKVDFLKILTEAGPDDDPSDDGGSEDLGGEDLGGDDFGGSDDFGDGSGSDFGGGPSHSHGHGDKAEELGSDDEESKEGTDFSDREDDPDFTGTRPAGEEQSAAESNPAGAVIYDTKAVLDGINSVVSASDVDLSEIEKAKNVLEVVANGKKLIDSDFDDIKYPQSFSDIINRALFQADEKTQNYFKLKIKSAILALQNHNKIDAANKEREVNTMGDLASKF